MVIGKKKRQLPHFFSQKPKEAVKLWEKIRQKMAFLSPKTDPMKIFCQSGQ